MDRVVVSLSRAQAKALHRVLRAASQNDFEAVQAYMDSDALQALDALVDAQVRRKLRAERLIKRAIEGPTCGGSAE